MKAEEFDRLFDEGVDMADYLDLTSLRRPNLEPRRLAFDLPTWIVNRLDEQAAAAGVTREALIERWLGERLEQEAAQPPVAAE